MITFLDVAHMTHGVGYGSGWGGGMITFLDVAHMADATSRTVWGMGGVKFLHIERKITSVVHSHPPSHYIRKHAPG